MLPQLPQLLASCRVFTQLLPQSWEPDGQAHWPLLQLWPRPQALPQIPQLLASCRVFTQLLPQSWEPDGQVHWPLLQLWPGPQALSHMPQWDEFVLRVTHELPHCV